MEIGIVKEKFSSKQRGWYFIVLILVSVTLTACIEYIFQLNTWAKHLISLLFIGTPIFFGIPYLNQYYLEGKISIMNDVMHFEVNSENKSLKYSEIQKIYLYPKLDAARYEENYTTYLTLFILKNGDKLEYHISRLKFSEEKNKKFRIFVKQNKLFDMASFFRSKGIPVLYKERLN